MAVLAPARRAIHQERIARITAERERLAGAAAIVADREVGAERRRQLLFLQVEDAEALGAKLRSLGIRVRFRPNAAPGGLRLTIGTEAENAAALDRVRRRG